MSGQIGRGWVDSRVKQPMIQIYNAIWYQKTPNSEIISKFLPVDVYLPKRPSKGLESNLKFFLSLSFQIAEFMDKIGFILDYFECLKFSSVPNSKIHLKISKFAKFNLNMADDSVKMEDGKKYSPRTLRKRVTF